MIYLQDYLQSFKNTCLIVSHDRGFLNNVCSDIILLNGRKLTYYKARGLEECLEKRHRATMRAM